MTRLSARCLVLLLVASLCFAVFTIGVSAADSGIYATAQWFVTSGSSSSYKHVSIMTQTSDPNNSLSIPSGSTAYPSLFTFRAPSAGQVTFTMNPGSSTAWTPPVGTELVESGAAMASTSQYWTFSVPSPGLYVFQRSDSVQASPVTTSILSLRVDFVAGSSPDPSNADINDTGASSGGLSIYSSNKNFTSSPEWKAYNQYIGEYIVNITTDDYTTDYMTFLSRQLAGLTYFGWGWKYENGQYKFVRPSDAEGSWLDNIFQQNTIIYHQLRNSQGWFGSVLTSFSELSTKVSSLNRIVHDQLYLIYETLLSIDRTVNPSYKREIEDLTKDHREWIMDYFLNDDEYDPDTLDDLYGGLNTAKNQFGSSYDIGDIGSIFTGTSYDNNFWYSFWSQAVSNDVNGGVSTLSDESSPDRWADRYSYDDDTIPDMTGFGGDADG